MRRSLPRKTFLLWSPRDDRSIRGGVRLDIHRDVRAHESGRGGARLLALACILALTAGCDKAKELAGAQTRAHAAEPPPAERLDLTGRPDLVFHVFGERNDPRMMPIAVVENGALRPIVLHAAGWKQLDSTYLRAGSQHVLHGTGRSIGTVSVKRGMWEPRAQPLYSLPNCSILTPLAAVSLNTSRKLEFTVEFMATTAKPSEPARRRTMPAAEAQEVGREVSRVAAQRAGISASALNGLTFSATPLATRDGGDPTVVVVMMDPRAESAAATGQSTTHLLVIGERDAEGRFVAAFVHTANGPATSAEYRRFIDHADLTGDGQDEIILEGWQYGGDTFLAILGFRDGRWSEVFRSRAQWCLDRG